MLSQLQNEQEVVIAYYSRTLSRAEANYCATRKDLLAVVQVVKHFHPYLYGRWFTIRSDHASLQWILNLKHPEGQLARSMEILQMYNFSIIHRAGRKHENPDALSRRPCMPDCKFCMRQDKREAEHHNLWERDSSGTDEKTDPSSTEEHDYLPNPVWSSQKASERGTSRSQ